MYEYYSSSDYFGGELQDILQQYFLPNLAIADSNSVNKPKESKMKKIEDEYYVIVDDFSKPNIFWYIRDNPDHVRRLRTDTQIQPLRYLIDKDNWLKGKAPADITDIFDGLLVNDKIKQDLYIKLTDANIMIHPSYAVSPDDDYFEGYWLIAIPAAPISWIKY